MKLVVTIVGRDQVGIVAMVSGILAEQRVNIMNVNQNIMDGFFNMVMIAEMPDDAEIRLKDLQEMLRKKGRGVRPRDQGSASGNFQVMHSI